MVVGRCLEMDAVGETVRRTCSWSRRQAGHLLGGIGSGNAVPIARGRYPARCRGCDRPYRIQGPRALPWARWREQLLDLPGGQAATGPVLPELEPGPTRARSRGRAMRGRDRQEAGGCHRSSRGRGPSWRKRVTRHSNLSRREDVAIAWRNHCHVTSLEWVLAPEDVLLELDGEALDELEDRGEDLVALPHDLFRR